MKLVNWGLLAVLVVTSVTGLTLNAWAISFVVGDYKFYMDGVSRFEDPAPPAGNVQATGNLWGVSQVTSIMRDSGGDIYDIPHWSKGQDSEYLTVRFGGLDLTYDGVLPTGYHITDSMGTPLASSIMPHHAYFESDSKIHPVAPFEIGPNAGANYAEIWLNVGVDPYSTDIFTVGAVQAAGGAKTTFGTTMAAGTLALDMVFAPGALWMDETNNNPAAVAAYQTDEYRAVVTGNTRNETLGYLDIVGGTWQLEFDTDGHMMGDPLLGVIGRTVGFDVRIEASNSSATPTPLSPEMIAAGWTTRNESSSALLSNVPEPGSMLLLGTGLMGLAGYARRRFRKK